MLVYPGTHLHVLVHFVQPGTCFHMLAHPCTCFQGSQPVNIKTSSLAPLLLLLLLPTNSYPPSLGGVTLVCLTSQAAKPESCCPTFHLCMQNCIMPPVLPWPLHPGQMPMPTPKAISVPSCCYSVSYCKKRSFYSSFYLQSLLYWKTRCVLYSRSCGVQENIVNLYFAFILKCHKVLYNQ